MNQYDELMNDLVKLKVINLQNYNKTIKNIYAILGFTELSNSFKSILGLGILLLAREKNLLQPNQPIIESTSGSLGVALAWSSKLLGHPLYIVVDKNVNKFNLKKMELLGANILMAPEGNFSGGNQEAREIKLMETLNKNPALYNVDQHHSPLNPEVYERWLIPHLKQNIDFKNIKAGVFCVGTGGHFVALSKMLGEYNIPSYVAELQGSITFGGKVSPSIIRGAGNQLYIPKIIKDNMALVKDVIYATDDEILDGLKELSSNNIVVGGTSGLNYACIKKLNQSFNKEDKGVLTFFADRGDIYWESIYQNL